MWALRSFDFRLTERDLDVMKLARLAGPVFEFELLTTSRRARFYLARSGYAFGLLLVFWAVYEMWVAEVGKTLTPRGASRFALATFGAIAVLQECLVLTLTPVLVAGVIAVEKQGKTLHYLMASPLTGLEIVAGKVLSRLVHVAVFLAVSLPVLSLHVLLGGIDPQLVWVSVTVSMTSAWCVAGLSVWASVYARRVREALFMAYALETLWLFVPLFFRYINLGGMPVVGHVLERLDEWLLASNPLHSGWLYLLNFLMAGGRIPLVLIDDLYTMAGLQALAGLVFVTLAVWRLRPVYRAQEGSARRSLTSVFLERRSPRLFRRPGVGDRPLLWKHLHTARGTRASRVVGWLAVLAIGAPIVYWTARMAIPAFEAARELAGRTPRLDRTLWAASQKILWFGTFLQAIIPLLMLVGLLRVAGVAGSSISAEHEDDTWVSLTTTDLTGREVVGSKMFGALVGPLWVWLFLPALGALGVMPGSLHWIGVTLACLLVAVDAAFVATFGVFVSMHLKSSWRAIFLTVGLLILINMAGQVALNVATLPRASQLEMPGFMPVDVARAVVIDPDTLRIASKEALTLRWSLDSLDQDERREFWRVAFVAANLVGYAAMAALCFWGAVRRFETAAGRPRRARCPHPMERALPASRPVALAATAGY